MFAGLFLVLLVAAKPSAVRAAWDCPELAVTPDSCGQAICPEDGVQASDALGTLKAAVGSAYCGACRCDVDASGRILASDAMRILRSAVGQPDELICSECNSLTLQVVENDQMPVANVASDSFSQATGLPYTTLGTAPSSAANACTSSNARYSARLGTSASGQIGR